MSDQRSPGCGCNSATNGLPLFRQEGFYARDLVELDRRLMAQWMGEVDFELEILADHVLGEIRKGDRVFADETSLPTLAPGTGTVKKAWSWAYARDDITFARTLEHIANQWPSVENGALMP